MERKQNNKLLYILIYGIAMFVLLEIVLRICFPIPEIENFNRINYQILDRHDDQSGYLRNIKMTWKSSLDTNHSFVHHFNQYGFRDPNEWKIKKKGKKRVFFVGDSFVEGMMSSSDKTIPVGFEKAAKENDLNIETFNCGMMGIGLNEYMKFIKDAVPVFRPDELILVLYANDAPFQREYIPENSLQIVKANKCLPRLVQIINQINKEDPIPFTFLPEERPFYKAVPDPGNPWTKHSEELRKDVTPKIAEEMKKGDFNFFRRNWILEEQKFLQSDISIKQKLEIIQYHLAKSNTKLSIFYVPSRSQVSNYYYQFELQSCLRNCPDVLDLTGSQYQKHAAAMANDCKDLNIPFHDFTTQIRLKENAGNHLYWDYDDHMRGNSYLWLGQEIYKIWLENQKN